MFQGPPPEPKWVAVIELGSQDGPEPDDDVVHANLEDWYPEWHKKAACLGKVAEADENFYGQDEKGIRPSLNASQIRKARATCAQCPVTQECLESALSRREKYGVWAGTTGRFRAQLFVMIDEGFMDLAAAMAECLRRLYGTESDDEDQDLL